MNAPATPPRPREFAVLLLASSARPPRQRARDQQADNGGGEMLRRMLSQLMTLNPEPDAIEEALMAIVLETGEPTGPARGVASHVIQQWRAFSANPRAWEWLLAEALAGEPATKGRTDVP